jgi:hypothetical protein
LFRQALPQGLPEFLVLVEVLLSLPLPFWIFAKGSHQNYSLSPSLSSSVFKSSFSITGTSSRMYEKQWLQSST